ncbi:uncharacterized protein LOC135645663 [Musa acuminata AAA Group]|uniref:uncharacterized protein LOC135645663 n=1 Tax=Musa acuminata AAA Group TaxID=214697 RepID=UPI0031D88CF2
MEGRELPRSMMMSEQLSNVDSSDPRDHVKVREEDETDQSCRQSSDSVAITCEKRESSTASGGLRGGGRRLFDVIQQVREANAAAAGGNSSGSGSKWKSLRDRIRRAGAAWAAASSAQPHPISDPELVVPSRRSPFLGRSVSRSVSVRNPYPISDPELVVSSRSNPVRDRSVSLSVSVRNSEPPVPEPTVMAAASEKAAAVSSAGGNTEFGGGQKYVPGGTYDSSPLAAARAEEEEEEEEEDDDDDDDDDEEDDDEEEKGDGEGEGGEQPARMSLMALLDMQWGGSGKEGLEAEEEEEEDEEEEEEVAEEEGEGAGDGMLYVCCVCMVRHKGAAFIPCGHTFCRLCSRELWVSRGNCPLCNGYILEILDIF